MSARFNGNSQYLVYPPPVAKKRGEGYLKQKEVGYTRTSNVAKLLEDGNSLINWKLRMVLLGAARKPDLLALAQANHDNDEEMDKLAQQCLDAADANRGANMGTALHAVLHAWGEGRAVPPLVGSLAEDLAAVQKVLGSLNVRILPEWCEHMVVHHRYKVAGTFDLLVELLEEIDGIPAGTICIADFKTTKTKSIEYGFGAWCIQLATYSTGTPYVQDPKGSEPRERDWPEGFDPTIGFIIHAPVGEARCQVFKLDLTAGAEALEHALYARQWRKRDNLATRFPAINPRLLEESVERAIASKAPTPPARPVDQREALLDGIQEQAAEARTEARNTAYAKVGIEPSPMPGRSLKEIIEAKRAAVLAEAAAKVPQSILDGTSSIGYQREVSAPMVSAPNVVSIRVTETPTLQAPCPLCGTMGTLGAECETCADVMGAVIHYGEPPPPPMPVLPYTTDIEDLTELEASGLAVEVNMGTYDTAEEIENDATKWTYEAAEGLADGFRAMGFPTEVDVAYQTLDIWLDPDTMVSVPIDEADSAQEAGLAPIISVSVGGARQVAWVLPVHEETVHVEASARAPRDADPKAHLVELTAELAAEPFTTPHEETLLSAARAAAKPKGGVASSSLFGPPPTSPPAAPVVAQAAPPAPSAPVIAPKRPGGLLDGLLGAPTPAVEAPTAQAVKAAFPGTVQLDVGQAQAANAPLADWRSIARTLPRPFYSASAADYEAEVNEFRKRAKSRLLYISLHHPEWIQPIADEWPHGVPGFKSTHKHTYEEIVAIEDILADVETKLGLPWPGPLGGEADPPPNKMMDQLLGKEPK